MDHNKLFYLVTEKETKYLEKILTPLVTRKIISAPNNSHEQPALPYADRT
jgi:hypothetical protein